MLFNLAYDFQMSKKNSLKYYYYYSTRNNQNFASNKRTLYTEYAEGYVNQIVFLENLKQPLLNHFTLWYYTIIRLYNFNGCRTTFSLWLTESAGS